MKKRFFAATLSAVLLVTAAGCGSSAIPPTEDNTLNILATTYPVYLFTTAVTDGVEGVEVTRLINEEVSCLHDYTLSVNDMKAIEKADVIVMNGAGLEDFMSDALATSDAVVIDCSEGIELLPATGHHDHDHGEETEGEHFDPHFWLDPQRAIQMVENINAGLNEIDGNNSKTYAANTEASALVLSGLTSLMQELGAQDLFLSTQLITFHDGFQYFADAFGLNLLKSIEEEEGAEASAAEIKEIVALIEEHDIPAIFVEKNGSDSTAQAIARETGVAVYELDMLMSGEGSNIRPYVEVMHDNLQTIAEALK